MFTCITLASKLFLRCSIRVLTRVLLTYMLRGGKSITIPRHKDETRRTPSGVFWMVSASRFPKLFLGKTRSCVPHHRDLFRKTVSKRCFENAIENPSRTQNRIAFTFLCIRFPIPFERKQLPGSFSFSWQRLRKATHPLLLWIRTRLNWV